MIGMVPGSSQLSDAAIIVRPQWPQLEVQFSPSITTASADGESIAHAAAYALVDYGEGSSLPACTALGEEFADDEAPRSTNHSPGMHRVE
jgi:hypothetical protein